MTISKLASDVAENHWETKGMKQALQAERDYNLTTTQKLERLKVRNAYSLKLTGDSRKCLLTGMGTVGNAYSLVWGQ